MLFNRRVLLLASSTALLGMSLVSLGEQERKEKRRRIALTQGEVHTKKYPFVILGSGTAAHAALETLRLNDPNSEVLMISASEGTLLPRMDQSSSHMEIDSASSTYLTSGDGN